jgi:hypothetical protein
VIGRLNDLLVANFFMELKEMRISRLGILVLITLTVFVTTNCSVYNRVMARKNLVDGAEAYKNRKFAEAEEKFRTAVEYDPEIQSVEGRTAQLFLARTLHSKFAGNRGEKQPALQAIEEYKKALGGFMPALKDSKTALDQNAGDEKLQKQYQSTADTVGSIVRAVASLFENLQDDAKWRDWQLNAAQNKEYPNKARANAYIALGAKENSCANDISDAEPVKKTVEKDGASVFEFTKPEDEETFEKFKSCVTKGTDYIDKAVELDKNSESGWSYRTSLIVQQMRLAEMQGENDKKDQLKKEADEAKERFQKLAEERRKKEEAEEAARKAEEAKEKGEAPPEEKK